MKEMIIISLITVSLIVVAKTAIPSNCKTIHIGKNLESLDTELDKEIRGELLILNSLQN